MAAPTSRFEAAPAGGFQEYDPTQLVDIDPTNRPIVDPPCAMLEFVKTSFAPRDKMVAPAIRDQFTWIGENYPEALVFPIRGNGDCCSNSWAVSFLYCARNNPKLIEKFIELGLKHSDEKLKEVLGPLQELSKDPTNHEILKTILENNNTMRNLSHIVRDIGHGEIVPYLRKVGTSDEEHLSGYWKTIILPEYRTAITKGRKDDFEKEQQDFLQIYYELDKYGENLDPDVLAILGSAFDFSTQLLFTGEHHQNQAQNFLANPDLQVPINQAAIVPLGKPAIHPDVVIIRKGAHFLALVPKEVHSPPRAIARTGKPPVKLFAPNIWATPTTLHGRVQAQPPTTRSTWKKIQWVVACLFLLLVAIAIVFARPVVPLLRI